MKTPYKIALCALGIALALGFVHLLAKYGMMYLAFYDQAPEAREAYQEYIHTPVSFPEEFYQSPPFSDELKVKAQRLKELWPQYDDLVTTLTMTTWTCLGDKAGRHDEPGDPEDLRAGLETLEPLLDAWRDFVTTPGYDYLATNLVEWKGYFYGSMESTGFSLYMQFLIPIKARYEMTRGDMDSAAEWLNLILTGSRTGGALNLHEISLVRIFSHVRYWRNAKKLLNATSDSRLLEAMLKVQNECLIERSYMSFIQLFDNLESLANIRLASRYGLKTQLEPMTGAELEDFSYGVVADLYEDVFCSLQSTLARKEQCLAVAEEMRGWQKRGRPALSSRIFGDNWIVNRYSEPQTFSMRLMFDSEDKEILFDMTAAQLNVLCAATASRLFELENGRPPSGWDDLVPALLPAVPEDPFRDPPGSLVFGPSCYSVGPDRIDQGAGICYDPTNGTYDGTDPFYFITPGDIFVTAK